MPPFSLDFPCIFLLVQLSRLSYQYFLLATHAIFAFSLTPSKNSRVPSRLQTKKRQRQFDVTKEDLQSLSPSASANLMWGLAKTEAAFADSFDRECLEVVAADMGPKLLSFSPRVRQGVRRGDFGSFLVCCDYFRTRLEGNLMSWTECTL